MIGPLAAGRRRWSGSSSTVVVTGLEERRGREQGPGSGGAARYSEHAGVQSTLPRRGELGGRPAREEGGVQRTGKPCCRREGLELKVIREAEEERGEGREHLDRKSVV